MGVKAIRWDSSLHPSITIEKSDVVHAVHTVDAAYTMQGVRALTRQRHCLSTNFVLAGDVLSAPIQGLCRKLRDVQLSPRPL